MSTTSDSAGSAGEKFIPLSEPCLRGNEWNYVKECLDSGWISSVGEFVNRFERATAACVGARHAVATVNGTSALHTALMVAGVKPGDEVPVSTLTFIASANAIRYAGAYPVLIDAEPDHWQMDPELLKRFLEDECTSRNGELVNRRTGRPIRAVMPVHVLGHPADMSPIRETARRFDLRVIEDAAESLGATYQGKPLGTDSDLLCLSFNGNKTITCGGGGMLITSSDRDAARARYLTTQAKDDAVEYIHNEVGYNYRMTNVLAAIGVAQLEQLGWCVSRRREIAAEYRDRLNLPGWQWHSESPIARSTCWLSTAQIDPKLTTLRAVQIRDRLAVHRIQTRRLWQPMHLSPAHQDCQSVLTGVSDRLFEQCLSFPSTPGLSSQDLDRVVTSVVSVLRGQCSRAA
jgi:perosamine synthetase